MKAISRAASATAWAGRAVAGLIVLACAAMLLSRLGAPVRASWDVAWTSAAIAALIGCLSARATDEAADRAAWTRWALASACWLFGQLAWNVYDLISVATTPSVADLGWWAFALLGIGGIVITRAESRVERAANLTESLALTAATIALCAATLLPLWRHSTLSLAPKLLTLVYPVLYVTVAVLALHEVVSRPRRQGDLALQIVVGGIAAEAVAFILWSYQLLERDYNPGATWIDPLWVLGLAAIAIGGMLASRRPLGAAQSREPTHRGGVLPSGLLVVLLVALFAAHLTQGTLASTLSLEIGVLFCGGALAVRSALLARNLRALLERERDARGALSARESELARLNAELRQESRRDPLTGISNRRALSDDLPMLDALGRENGASVAFALCDVDRFKAYNDSVGHLAGDQALRTIAATIRSSLRAGDRAYRFGGEELLIVLRDAGPAEATAIADRIRCAVQRAALPHPGAPTGVLTVSVGIASGNGDAGRLIELADAAVYEAKNRGRNCVVHAGEAQANQIGVRPRTTVSEEPLPRQMRSMLAISRAAAAGGGQMAVLESLADAIHTEMSFGVVAVNVLDDEQTVRVAIVRGEPEAREALLHTTSPIGEWHELLAAGQEIAGAIWLEAGTYESAGDTAVWTPPEVAAPTQDAWHPEDMLLLPLRGASGRLLGIVSVDQPLLGRRPEESELRMLMAVIDHAALAVEQAHRMEPAAASETEELRLAAVMLLAETLDLRDPSTARHARTVGELAGQIAGNLGLDPGRVERIHAAGVLHDLGKLGVADAVLHKTGPLDDREWEEMRRHPEIGAQILEHAGMHDIAAWVRAHHERLDGRGYPDALSAHEIPLEARILAVADAYEAMIADRPYRRGMAPALAREELERCSGTQFDPVVVHALLIALACEEPTSPPAAELQAV